MEKEKIDILCEGLYAATSNLSTFILGGCAFLLTILLIKAFSKEQKAFKILDVEIPLNRLWVVIAAYTLGHLYFSIIVNQRIDRLNQERIENEKEEIWTQITYGEKAGSLFSNMEKRTEKSSFNFLGFPIYKMKKGDVTTWISVLMIVLLFFSTFDFKVKTLRGKVYSAYFGLLFCLINWTIGSWWAVQISTLAP